MRPTWKSMLMLFVAAAVLTGTSGIGQDTGYWKSAPQVIGDISWLGSMIFVLALIASGIYMAVSRMRHHGQPSTQ